MDYNSFKNIISSDKKIHLIGIGGVSMSALAKLLASLGASVSGSDRAKSTVTLDLETRGMEIFHSHEASNITEDTALVIRTSAVRDDNPEVIRAHGLNIPLLERAEAWGIIMTDYEDVICLSGTHGKTTTTSMMGHILMRAELDPTIMVGSDLPSIDGTLRIGTKDFFVAESCEYCNSFLNFKPTIGVVLNIEEDHLDFFSGIDDILNSFNSFLKMLPPTGVAIVNGDDEFAPKCTDNIDAPIMTFGTGEECSVRAVNITPKNGYYTFDVLHNGDFYSNVTLSVPGHHNMMNALSCCAAAIFIGIDGKTCAKGLLDFTGSSRRFQKIGEAHGALIVDDYAHHPSEIVATLKTAKMMDFSRIVCVFQPHTYTRTHALLNEFVEALKLADTVILSDIYAAREKNTVGISSKDIADKIDGSEYISSFNEITEKLKSQLCQGDLLITMGAGDINKIAYKLTE